MNIVITAKSKEDCIRHIAMDEGLHTYIWVNNAGDFSDFEEADAFIDFNENVQDYTAVKKPLLINQTAKTLDDIKCNRQLTARFCGWPGLAERAKWEIAVDPTADIGKLEHVMKTIGKEMIGVKDIAGLIAPRILCTIINEACYTISEDISDAGQIDIAMKLGTNYPDGPISWGKKIGASRIIELLNTMSAENSRYAPHGSLLKMLA